VATPEALESVADADLARRILAGGEGALVHEGELCRRYLNRARLYGLRHLRFDVTAAEDLAQQVMMIVLEALRGGRVADLERIDRFMLGTCRNVAHSMRRTRQRQADTAQRLRNESGPSVVAPWDAVESRRVEDCLGRLAPREARALALLFQEGHTAEEAASALGTTPGNVRVIRHRAIVRLRDCVAASGSPA
jgi:RNA polymerase sigma-70 factor (ECF subfamily)